MVGFVVFEVDGGGGAVVLAGGVDGGGVGEAADVVVDGGGVEGGGAAVAGVESGAPQNSGSLPMRCSGMPSPAARKYQW